MAPSCGLDKNERVQRILIGTAFVVTGFLARRDAFASITLVLTGSAITAAASLGY